jgi:DNA-binding PadR family transcriptional regulator
MISSKLIVGDIERRIISRFMDLLILSILDHDGGEISGYDIIKYFHSKFGLLMSPGTVYSCMHSMEREDLLKGKNNGKKRVYTLTQHGRETVRIIQKGEARILRFMSNFLPRTEH